MEELHNLNDGTLLAGWNDGVLEALLVNRQPDPDSVIIV
jgi:hypothetical protein